MKTIPTPPAQPASPPNTQVVMNAWTSAWSRWTGSFLAVLVVMSMAACGPDAQGCPQGADGMMCRERLRPAGERRDACINRKLDEMSDSDHVQRWDAALVHALYDVCAKLYPEVKR